MGEVSLQCREAARRGAGCAVPAVAIACPRSGLQEDDALCSDRCQAVSIAVAGCLSLLCDECVLESSLPPRTLGWDGLFSRCFRLRYFISTPSFPQQR